MKKGLVIGLIVGGILLAATVSSAIIIGLNLRAEGEKGKAFDTALNAIEGVVHAQHEIQHPGLPTNNDIVILAALEVKTPEQLADTIEAILKATYQADLKDYYDVTLYAIDASSTDDYRNRKMYFQSDKEIDRDISTAAYNILANRGIKDVRYLNTSRLEQIFGP